VGGRDEAVGPRLREPHEQSDARHARDARLETGADLLAHVGGDETIGGLALGRHGAPFGARNALSDVGKILGRHVRQTARPRLRRGSTRDGR